jgi:hypothetical protein
MVSATRKTWTSSNLLKVVGLTVLYIALLSVNYSALTLSNAATKTPTQLILVALIDTMLLSYFVLSSRWKGWKEWAAVFAILYGMVYVLTVAETFFLGGILPANMVPTLLVNGAITSAIFAAALAWVLGSREMQGGMGSTRLKMPGKEWAWKILVSAVVFLLLFFAFGFIVYMPLGKALDPVAYTQEQSSIASNTASLVFPIELLRGALWALFAVPAIIALPFGWKKTGVIVGLLMAVPLALSQFLSTTMTIGLQIAHTAEILGENMVFGFLLVCVLRLHSRLPAEEPQELHVH